MKILFRVILANINIFLIGKKKFVRVVLKNVLIVPLVLVISALKVISGIIKKKNVWFARSKIVSRVETRNIVISVEWANISMKRKLNAKNATNLVTVAIKEPIIVIPVRYLIFLLDKKF